MRFADRHRIQVGLAVEDAGGRLRVGPAKGSLKGVAAGMAFLSGLGFLMISWFEPVAIHRKSILLVFVISIHVVFGFLGILHAIGQYELAKGPVLEVDRLRRAVALPRDKREIAFDAIEGVALLIGYYEWTDEFDKVAEMSLLIEESGHPAPTPVPVVMTKDIAALEKLAERVAAILAVPLDRESRGRGDRQRNVANDRSISVRADPTTRRW